MSFFSDPKFQSRIVREVQRRALPKFAVFVWVVVFLFVRGLVAVGKEKHVC